MNRRIKILASILALQAGLAVLLHFTSRSMSAYASEERLLGLEAASLDKIVIEDGEKPALVLMKKSGMWVLPDHYGFPASKTKLDGFTKKLLGIKLSWPIATTQGAAKRFRVGEDAYEKKIVFYEGDKEIETLFIGSSPDFRKVHARVAGANDIYAVEFSAYDAGIDPNDWVDKDILRLEQSAIDRVEMPTFTLERKEGEFVVSGLKKNEETVADEASSLISKLADISFREVLGTENKPEYRQSSPALVIAATMKSGERVDYVFSQVKNEEDAFILKVSAHDYYFEVGKYDVEDLKEFKRKKLLRPHKTKS
ncbi:MAG: DUF4340 domain-containing protein [Anaerolineales bacterium]|nr:DUF4340 domain-containing protein [Anaerolineales bacterium]